jgi:hypothetical protein
MIAALSIAVVAFAVGYSLYLGKRRPAEFHAWTTSLLSSFLSVVGGVITALLMFSYQDARQSEARRDQLAGLVALELENDLGYLRHKGLDVQIGTNTWHFKTAMLEHQAVNAAALSGLFTSAKAKDLLVLGTNIRFYNDLIASLDRVFAIPSREGQVSAAQNLYENQQGAFQAMVQNITACLRGIGAQEELRAAFRQGVGKQ